MTESQIRKRLAELDESVIIIYRDIHYAGAVDALDNIWLARRLLLKHLGGLDRDTNYGCRDGL